MCIEANVAALAFERRKGFDLRMDWRGDERSGADLSPWPRAWGRLVRGSGEGFPGFPVSGVSQVLLPSGVSKVSTLVPGLVRNNRSSSSWGCGYTYGQDVWFLRGVHGMFQACGIEQ